MEIDKALRKPYWAWLEKVRERGGAQRFNDKDLYIRDVATLRLLKPSSDKRLSKVDHISKNL